jgi:hypothetical protein
MIPNRLNHQLKTIKIKIKLIETVVSSFTSVVYIERIYKKKKKKVVNIFKWTQSHYPKLLVRLLG